MGLGSSVSQLVDDCAVTVKAQLAGEGATVRGKVPPSGPMVRLGVVAVKLQPDAAWVMEKLVPAMVSAVDRGLVEGLGLIA